MSTLTDRVRNPEYVGENRCILCTITNAIIAVAATVVVFSLVDRAWPVAGAAAVAAATLLVSTASIYARGYLVPGTPTLTRRYFPDQVLQWFGKRPPTFKFDGKEPREMLVELGTLDRSPEDGTHYLSDSFAAEWTARIDSLTADGDCARTLLDRTDIDADDAAIKTVDGGRRRLRLDGQVAATWQSSQAVCVDAAAAYRLQDANDRGWRSLDARIRLSVLRELRAYLDDCPTCGGPLEIDREQFGLCCMEEFRPVLRCADCGEELLAFEGMSND